MRRYIQVYPDHLLNFREKNVIKINFCDIDTFQFVCWSIFYIKMKDGTKHYFHSRYERVDYVWEGIYQSRPDLMTFDVFNNFRIKLVQYDHYQKRKEWFFKHKITDVLNWVVLPISFLIVSFLFQSKDIIIYQREIYFFRLFMYAMLIVLITTFFYTLILKKFIFDRKVAIQIETFESKTRDLEFEGLVLQRSKVFQIFTASFLLITIMKIDLNLFSVAKINQDITTLRLKKGNTIIVDNRYNCVSCKYQLKDGDYVIFGKGSIGQLLAKEGELVGELNQDLTGRTFASENVKEVPPNHVAIKTLNGRDVSFVKLEDLIGKIQK
jgi:hypothetical protein